MSDKTDLSQYSKLCQKCVRNCKQNKAVTVINCPRYVRAPVQMTLPLKFGPGRPKKHKPLIDL
ncbi:MAG: hypothetical protein ACOYIS_05500 [Candidatus Cloacimonadaceae bacterium]